MVVWFVKNVGMDRVVDVATQIRTDTSAADMNGPGELRHAVVLKPTPANALSTSDTFNLASTRVIAFTSSGNKTLRFILTQLRMGAGTSCLAYNATFSVSIP
jgi:hypothetical protein